MNDRSQLQKELRQAGASTAEVKELPPIAASLRVLKNLDTKAINRTHPRVSFWQRAIKPAAFALSGLAVGMALVIISQGVLPSSWLYPVQKASDSVAIRIDAQYRANVMMKRAQQVNELVANHASSKLVLATLADYTKDASTYKSMPHANYAAFEYCKTNLQQATTSASPSIHEAIATSLQNLQTT